MPEGPTRASRGYRCSPHPGSPPIRVLFVSHAADHSGAPISLSILLRHFCATTGWEARVLLKKDGPNRGLFDALAPTWNFGPGPADRARARKEVRRFAPDLIYSNTAMNGDVLADLEKHQAVAADVAVLVHVRDRMGLSLLGGSGRDHFLHRSGRLLAVSAAVERELVSGFGFAPERIGRGPVCLDVAATRAAAGADRAAVRAALGVPEGGLLIGNAGQLIPRKGPDLFVEAAAELVRRHPEPERLRFVWIGDADPDGRTRAAATAAARAAGLGDQILFAGLRENPQPELAALDLLLMTSRDDPFPRVVLEAGLHGVPSVAWEAAGGACEFLEPSAQPPAGAIAGRGREELAPLALAAAAHGLLADSARLAEAGQVARQRAEGFDIADVGPAVVAEVEAFAAASRRAGSPPQPEPSEPSTLPELPPSPTWAVLLLSSGEEEADRRSLASVAQEVGGTEAVLVVKEGASLASALADLPEGVDLVAPLVAGDTCCPGRLARMLAFAAATPTAAGWGHPLAGSLGGPPLGFAGDLARRWRRLGWVPCSAAGAAAGTTEGTNAAADAATGPSPSGLLLRADTLVKAAAMGKASTLSGEALWTLAALDGPVAWHPEALGTAGPGRPAASAEGRAALHRAFAARGETLRCLPLSNTTPSPEPLPDAADAWRSPSSESEAAWGPPGSRASPAWRKSLRPSKHNAVRLLHRLGLEATARSLLGRPGSGETAAR